MVGGARADSNTLFGDGPLSDNAVGGDDVLVSGVDAPDLMWGDGDAVGLDAKAGFDRFVFAPGNGADVIGDFEVGKDGIDLIGFAAVGISGFSDLALVPTTTGMMIDFGGDNSITVLGVTALSRADFSFG